MSEPDDPDWGFPEVDPASTELPPDDDVREALEALSSRGDAVEGPFDTGSDAWWRAQAAAQRAAAAKDPHAPPPAVPPTASGSPPAADPGRNPTPNPGAPTPLDVTWLPDDLAPSPSGPPQQAETPAPPRAAPPAASPPSPPVVPSPPPVAPPVEKAPPAPPQAPAAPSPPAASAPPPLPPVPPVPPVPPAPRVSPDRVADEAAQAPPAPPVAADHDFYDGLRARPGPGPVGPRRAMVGAVIAVLGVLLGIGGLLVLRDDEPTGGPTVALPTHQATGTSPTRAPSAKPTPKASATPLPRATTPPPVLAAPIRPVTVLNNSRVKGLADRSARKFSAGGWPIADKGNYRGGTIARTTVYYAPGQLGSAQRFARQFDIPRVLPRFSGLPGSGLTVVLTRDYS